LLSTVATPQERPRSFFHKKDSAFKCDENRF
jgi:hypothetical protein